ncbi:hypothetical protein DPQ25_12540 [Hydrogeniiclostridium mannosilyticum]|uniref:Uncharacterized protein n=1 Tax=Hydrogeniiclostridium mannosilyticum TaxID=2764322 RepID=A0A328U8V4_9FIRM|nr:hypothetical protein DPQ25_12540 [Hydrogeniiclostridium mannosilyticum]
MSGNRLKNNRVKKRNGAVYRLHRSVFMFYREGAVLTEFFGNIVEKFHRIFGDKSLKSHCITKTFRYNYGRKPFNKSFIWEESR